MAEARTTTKLIERANAALVYKIQHQGTAVFGLHRKFADHFQQTTQKKKTAVFFVDPRLCVSWGVANERIRRFSGGASFSGEALKNERKLRRSGAFQSRFSTKHGAGRGEGGRAHGVAHLFPLSRKPDLKIVR